MAQYEVNTAPLIEASDTIRSISDVLDTVYGRLAGVLSDMPECLGALRQQIARDCGAVGGSGGRATELGRALYEIAEIYAQAEQPVFGVGANNMQAAAAGAPPKVALGARGVFLHGSLVLPDWLKEAIMRYEQFNAPSVNTT